MRRVTTGAGSSTNSIRRRLSGAFNASVARDSLLASNSKAACSVDRFGGGPPNSKRGRDSLAASVSRPSGSASRYNTSTRRTANDGPLKDPRNLSNRGKQKEMIDEVLHFLSINGYPHQMSQKILSAPTSKDFIKIFEFLYGILDKQEKIDGKVEEEIPRLLRQIGYPFPIPKSTMFTIGSLHTWPTLLGALHWMVDIIEYCQVLDPMELVFCQDEDHPSYGCDKIADRYMSKTYKDFLLEGECQPEDDEQVTEAILQHHGASKEYDNQIRDEIADLEKELADLEAEPDRVKAMQDEISFYNTECEKIEQQEQAMLLEEEKYDMKQEAILTKLHKFDHSDVRRTQSTGALEYQRDLLESRLTAQLEENEKLQTRCWEKEINFSKVSKRVDKILSEYNEHVRNVLIDKMAVNVLHGQDISIKFDYKENGILTASKFKDSIKEILIQAENDVSADIRRLESERIAAEDKFEKLTEMCSEKNREITNAQMKVENAYKEIEEFQEKATSEQTAAEQEHSSVREELKSLESSSSSHLAKREKELVQLKERVELEENEMEIKRQNAAKFLSKVVEKTLEHKNIIQTGVQKLHDDKLVELKKLESTSYSWQRN
eukprot:gene5940-6630_t